MIFKTISNKSPMETKKNCFGGIKSMIVVALTFTSNSLSELQIPAHALHSYRISHCLVV